MTPHILYLGLVMCVMTGLSVALEITDLFTVQKGTTFGGCDDQLATLDDYLQEAIDSLQTALSAVDSYNVTSADGVRIRRAVLTWFGVEEMGEELTYVREKVAEASDFFNGQLAGVPKAQTYLFCDSNWLVQKQAGDTAKDYRGRDIVLKGRPIPISEPYQTSLVDGNIPWYAGDHTSVYGYYFTGPDGGGNYCMGDDSLAVTSSLQALKQNRRQGTAEEVDWKNNNVVLCPSSFISARPASYQDGDAAIRIGTPLDHVVPRSSTFIHEVFHVLQGTLFNEGNDEHYGLADCMLQGMTNSYSASRNPENYVFFISAMYYLFGDQLEGNDPQSPISVYWDFTNGPDRARGPIKR